VDFEAPAWLVTWLQSVNVWDALLALAGLGALIWFIRRKGWKSLQALAHSIIHAAEIAEAVQGLPAFAARTDERLEKLTARTDEIHHETHKNDGSSIKDATIRMEQSLEGIHGRLDTIDGDVKTLRREMVAADEELRAEIENTDRPGGHHE